MDMRRTAEQQKQQTEQKSGMKEKIAMNIQENASEEDKQFIKMLHRPRSKKYMNALRNIDIPSMEDEMLIARMKEEREKNPGRSTVFDGIEENSTADALAEFKKTLAEEIERDIRRENEIKRKRENTIQSIVAKCVVLGCVVHTITSEGEILEHITRDALVQFPESIQKAGEIVLSVSDWTSVEIYEKKFVHRNHKGDTIKIYDRR